MVETRRTRTEETIAFFRARISKRALAAGDRLPSVRGLATTLGFSPSTVVEAYDRLAAEGLIHARRGSGFYVARDNLTPLIFSDLGPKQDSAVDPFWVSRQSLDASPTAAKPGCGWLPSDWMPDEALRRALRAISKSEPHVLFDYGNTRGSTTLRHLLARRWTEEGIEPEPEQVMLTSSGTHAIDLICRFLLRPGDTVLVDDPCYFNFRALLQAHRVNIVGIPYTHSGPDIVAFETALASSDKAKLYITNSAIHNPTGATMAPHTAYRIMSSAASHNLTIVEDDIFADFEPDPSVRLAALDGLNRVIRIGSFSKTLSASVRCGYIVGRRDWIDGLADLQVATSFGGPSPVAVELISQVLSGGSYRKHMEFLRQRLTRRRREVATQLSRIDIHPWTTPRGGFYLWCMLPDGIDSVTVARRALAENIVLAPGNVFSTSQSASSFVRMNVAQTDARSLEGIKRAICSASSE